MQTPIHLSIGQEAVAGVSCNLNGNDKVYGSHRGHSHYLALGASIEKLLAEVLGKATGAAKGMGALCLRAGSEGFHGSVPIVEKQLYNCIRCWFSR